MHFKTKVLIFHVLLHVRVTLFLNIVNSAEDTTELVLFIWHDNSFLYFDFYDPGMILLTQICQQFGAIWCNQNILPV